jgi:hypothetical protein
LSSSPGVASSRSETGGTLDRSLAAILRGDAVDVSALVRTDRDAFVAGADAHGVLSLVAERLIALPDLPREWRQPLQAEVRQHAAFDMTREAELRRLVAAFERRGVRVVLMKGAQLAYTLYPRPDLRPRIDTDILIARGDRDAAFAVLRENDYGGTGHVEGSLVMYQACYVKGRAQAPTHVVDLHWKIANPQVFADFLSFEEVVEQAVAVPVLGPGAWGLSPVHALLVACVHRVAHHYDASRLVWLYDIHLLASALTTDEWTRFDELARHRGVARVCRRSLDASAEALGTRVPDGVAVIDGADVEKGEQETAAFLGGGRRQVSVVASDLRALPSWRDRARLLSQHAFPSAVYMRSQYAPASSAPLPVLYARRVVRGAWKWFRKP